MTSTTDTTRTQRSRKRRDNLRAMGYTMTQIELSPLAKGALDAMRISAKKTQNELIERAILALYHKGA
jgi:hypothetical protein